MSENPRSVYALGAENGLVMGPLMAVCVLLVGATAYHAWLFLPALAAMIAVPSAAWFMLARTFDRGTGISTFSALWLQGICMFFFGGLLMAVAAYAAMRWICPSFIVDQMNTIISLYGSLSDPDARQVADTLQKMLDAKAIPTPIDIALELLYAAVFSGSILSMVLSALVRAIRRRRPPKFNQQ